MLVLHRVSIRQRETDTHTQKKIERAGACECKHTSVSLCVDRGALPSLRACVCVCERVKTLCVRAFAYFVGGRTREEMNESGAALHLFS